MRVYRSKQNWVPRTLFSLEPGKLVLCICTWVHSLDWEDPLEREMTIHSSILAWIIPWTEEPGGLQSIGMKCMIQTFIFP